MNIDSKISFISGFSLTTLWTMPLYELSMAFLLGLIGGVGGLVGKWLMKKLGWFNK
jgi:hypothetical protein